MHDRCNGKRETFTAAAKACRATGSGPKVAAMLEGGADDPHPLVREFALTARGHGTNPWVLL